MSFVESLHARHVFGRRIRVLAGHFANLAPQNASVLDVGCGDGQLDKVLLAQRPDLCLEGIDVLVRPDTAIPVRPFDGDTIPNADKSVDVVMFVDVLHHTEDPMILLKEAARVARHAVLIKDHTRDGLFASGTLRFMDHIGNARHGVVLPYNYWPKARWHAAFGTIDLAIDRWISKLGLYPWPASAIFERELHFITQLKPRRR